MIFQQRNCNYPDPRFAKWWLTQFRRWGMVDAAPDYEGVAKQVMRTDIYVEAMQELGLAVPSPSDEALKLFDGSTFDGKDPEAYAKSFAVHSLKS